MTVTGEICFKIDFLRAMAPVMTEPDLDTFTNICQHWINQEFVLADMVLLDQLFKKFSPGG